MTINLDKFEGRKEGIKKGQYVEKLESKNV